jgi:hypothetical protein
LSRALGLGVLLWALGAGAVPPDARWYTLETPNFRVHFHEGPHMYALAQRTARASEAAHALLVPRLRWAPSRRTEVILTDDVDAANGSAFTLYRPWMRLFAEPPEEQSVLNDYQDHLWNLVVHEYTHVLHLDTVTGLPEQVNRVFGKLLLPNAYVPRWLTEGLATWQESNLSNSGRLRSSLFDMWLRASILHRPFGIDEVSHVPHDWPRGSLAYLYGGHFMAYLAERVGEEAVPDFFGLHGGRPIPWALNDSARRVWPSDFLALYDDWVEHTRAGYEAQLRPVREAGVTPYRVLTRAGNNTDSPHFTHRGDRIVYIANAPDARPELRIVDGDGRGDRKVRGLWTVGPLDISPDDRHVVLALPEVHEEYEVFDDLWRVSLQDGDMVRLTHGLRATDPAFSPDGRRIAFVGRSGAGHSYLGILDLGSGEIRTLLQANERERLYSPVFAPDGRSVVFGQKRGVGRRLGQVGLDGGEARTLLEAEWLMLQPKFAADGQLVFSADRTGIYNLYALHPDKGVLTQLTNVETGAFHPSPADDGRLAFLTYSHQGYDVAVLDPAARFEGPPLAERPPRPPPVWEDDPRVLFPVHPYRPTRTLAPLFWLPLVGADPLGVQVGVVTGGADILERHAWQLEASYGLTSREPGFSAAYQNRTFHPGVDLWAQSGIAQAQGFVAGLYDRQWALGARTRIPSTSLDQAAALHLSYELRTFEPRFVPTFRPDDVRPAVPREGRAGTAALAFSFSNARAYAHSISQEEGFSLFATVRHSSRYTLGTFGFSSSEARVQRYFGLPWLSHHVLAVQLLGGAALGDLGGRPVYALGGVGVADPLLQLTRGGGVGGGVLRGYPPRVMAGNSLAFGSAEYRLPLLRVDRGVSSLPFFLRRLHGAAFVDVGATGPRAFTLQAPRVGVGAEVRTDFVLGYALPSQLRLGLARGLSPEGITQLYLTLGSGF